MPARHNLGPVGKRRGAAAVFVVVSLVALLGFAALAVDMGMLYVARGELQVAADAAALAGASELLNERRLRGPGEWNLTLYAARHKAAALAGLNPSLGTSPEVDINYSNDLGGDVVLGHLDHLVNMGEQLSVSNPDDFNTVLVRVRRDPSRNNGPVSLWFARILGIDSANVAVEAAAAFYDGIVGYEVTEETGDAELMPLALRDNPWDDLLGTLAGTNDIYNDEYGYDPETGQVFEGPDGIPELNLYPGSGDGQLPPGNFGTVDIGPPNNATDDLERQILYGISAQDLAYFGGQFSLADGPKNLSGDTGISVAVRDELEAIKGRPRAIPIFDHVSGPGENAVFRVVRFAGLRIMNVKLTGAMQLKNVMIQPAVVVDDAAMAGGTGNTSEYVYHPVVLVR